MRQPPGVELGARLERLDPPGLALQVLVRAVKEEGDKGADFVPQRRLGRGEGRLRDELVVLFVFRARRSAGCLQRMLRDGGCVYCGKHTRTVLRIEASRGKS